MSDKKGDKMQVLGLMSGTSLDGLDMALCEFTSHGSGVGYQIIKATTINYSQAWKNKLHEVKNAAAEDYFALHAAYGTYMAQEVNHFLEGPVKPALISSHGHTVFHQPHRGFSTQLGCGATIAALTGITTVCDLRSLDVALGGQGAPLVPIGDQLLFGTYQSCLNIGGIANISYNKAGERVAYDTCVANMLLNWLASKAGKVFDEGGAMARRGQADHDLLERLNKLDFYNNAGARSLGREWFEKNVTPLFTGSNIDNMLATATQHIALVIAGVLNKNELNDVLVTGGGAFNTYLRENISARTTCKLIVPEVETVNFKEALIFALLGYLRFNNQYNTHGSVTGAKRNSIGGALYVGGQ